MTLARVCFTICIVCIVVGAVMGIAMIWMERHDDLWKPLLTVMVIFISSGAVLTVDRAMRRE